MTPYQIASEWISKVSTIVGAFVAPVLLGLWLDYLWVGKPRIVMAGALLGFATGFFTLLRMVPQSGKSGHKH